MDESYIIRKNYNEVADITNTLFERCLNKPIASMTINMENKYGKNITELFRAFGGTTINNEGVWFYFYFYSESFEKNIEYTYILNRSKSKCVEINSINRKTSYVEIDYAISNMDWKDENTTITELNNNIATNMAYCLNNSDIQDTNWHVLRQNYYYIAKKNVVYIYACNNNCSDLTIQYYRWSSESPGSVPRLSIVNNAFVVDITNSVQNNMNIMFNTDLQGTNLIPLVIPVNITVTNGDWPSEISWKILKNGVEIINGGAGESINQPLPPGDYVFQAQDTESDGWDGAT